MYDGNAAIVVSKYLTEAADESLSRVALSRKDMGKLRNKGRSLARKVQRAEKAKKELSSFSDDDKRVLLAYIVFVRQNIIPGVKGRPNDEDAAKILHGEVFADDDKETKERLLEELIRQLKKAGVSIDD